MVRKLLNEKWNPIGFDGLPEDEYDTYGAKLYVMLMYEGATADAMANYLYEVECEYIGLGERSGRRACCRQVVDLLIALKPRLDAANDS